LTVTSRNPCPQIAVTLERRHTTKILRWSQQAHLSQRRQRKSISCSPDGQIWIGFQFHAAAPAAQRVQESYSCINVVGACIELLSFPSFFFFANPARTDERACDARERLGRGCRGSGI
jgi:hypothetical protein